MKTEIIRRARCAALFVFAAMLVPRGTPAQDAPGPWVREARTPQYFAVFVQDLDRSVEWYRTVFGLEPLGGSAADDGSYRIENLESDRLMVELIRHDRARGVDRALGFFKVGFGVPDVEVVADRAARATGERPRTVDFERFGLRVVQIRDPDGNLIQLSSPLEPESGGAGERAQTEDAAGAGPAACTSPSPERALEAVRRAYMDAFNAGDADAVADLHTEDVILLPAGRPSVTGRESLRELVRSSVSAAPEGFRFEFEPVEVRTGDGWAVERGVTRAADPIPAGKYAMLYEKGPDGCWRIAWSITNSDGPRPGR